MLLKCATLVAVFKLARTLFSSDVSVLSVSVGVITQTDRQTDRQREPAQSLPQNVPHRSLSSKKAVAEVSVCNFSGSLQAIARPLFSSDISALSVSVGVIRDLSGVSD